MGETYLALWLEAPLQSWGSDSKFYRRDSLDFPTRSGVLGLLCCAMGAGGSQVQWLSMMSQYTQTVLSYERKNNARGARLQDFHMVGSGYNEKDPWQLLLIPKTSEGKKAVGGGTKMTYRYYIQDRAFGIALAISSDQAQRIAEALLNPVWDLYLGRKSCAPTDKIYRGTFDDANQAKSCLDEIAKRKEFVKIAEILDGNFPEKGDVLTLNDVPVRFGDKKEYRQRLVTVVPIEESKEEN